MENLWAPWRSAYILGEAGRESGCIFCLKSVGPAERWPDDFVLSIQPRALVIMNLYPYNNGHVMVAPRAHVASPTGLPPEDHAALWDLVRASTAALEAALRPDGVNLGMNLGRVAGAGIADHCHVHLVPRWNGDTNFMPVIAETKVISQHLRETYDTLLPHFGKLQP